MCVLPPTRVTRTPPALLPLRVSSNARAIDSTLVMVCRVKKSIRALQTRATKTLCARRSAPAFTNANVVPAGRQTAPVRVSLSICARPIRVVQTLNARSPVRVSTNALALKASKEMPRRYVTRLIRASVRNLRVIRTPRVS